MLQLHYVLFDKTKQDRDNGLKIEICWARNRCYVCVFMFVNDNEYTHTHTKQTPVHPTPVTKDAIYLINWSW